MEGLVLVEESASVGGIFAASKADRRVSPLRIVFHAFQLAFLPENESLVFYRSESTK